MRTNILPLCVPLDLDQEVFLYPTTNPHLLSFCHSQNNILQKKIQFVQMCNTLVRVLMAWLGDCPQLCKYVKAVVALNRSDRHFLE